MRYRVHVFDDIDGDKNLSPFNGDGDDDDNII